MDNNSRNHGAYAQVTAPLEGEDPDVTVKPGGKKQEFWTRKKKLIVLGVILIIIGLAIIIGVIASNKKGAKAKLTGSPPTSTVASTVSKMPEMNTTAMSQRQTSMMTTTTQPPAPTTFGPAVAGTFEGALVIDRPFVGHFDDVRARITVELKANITNAMNEVFSDSNAPYMYVDTSVDQLLANGTNTQVTFTVNLNAINRGARKHLLEFIGPLPSTTMDTYTVLYTSIGQEQADNLGPA